jgi:hypothetical protein
MPRLLFGKKIYKTNDLRKKRAWSSLHLNKIFELPALEALEDNCSNDLFPHVIPSFSFIEHETISTEPALTDEALQAQSASIPSQSSNHHDFDQEINSESDAAIPIKD